jgi:hypothetical protein
LRNLTYWMKAVVRTLKLPFHHGKRFLLVLQCKLLFLIALSRNRFRKRYILALPDRPSPHTVFYKIAHRLGYSITRDPRRNADLVIFWQDQSERADCLKLTELAATRQVINGGCRDIRKQRVAEVFEQVFGYGLRVSPREHQGPMVMKSDGNNGCHDAVIVNGPVATQEVGYVYQRVVNNVQDNHVRDMRVPVVGGIIPYCLDKKMPIECRFNNLRGVGIIREPSELLTESELDMVRKFCTRFGLDYGELDVLRDYDDGRLYIVDVNYTPYGPINRDIDVKWYFDPTIWKSLEKLCRAFEEAFPSPPEGSWPTHKS